MPFKDHLEKTLKIDPGPTPLYKMLLSSIAITTPLIIGHFNHEVFASMFGALMALVIYLNDHFGAVNERFKHLLITFILLMISMALGAWCVGNNYAIVPVLFVLSFFVGKSKDFGLELERMMLFITLQFLTASSDVIMKNQLNSLVLYSFIALLIYMVTAYVIFLLSHHQTHQMNKKRDSIKKILSHNKSLKFPFVCAFFACLGFLVAQFFKFSHANWIVGTALIVMLPDSYQSIYKSIQRLLGTAAGVVLASVVLTYVHDPKLLIMFVFICAFLMPSGLSKNYWVANIYIAALILFFLEIASPLSIREHHLAFWRIVDIALGSLIGVIAALTLKPEIIKPKTKSLKY